MVYKKIDVSILFQVLVLKYYSFIYWIKYFLLERNMYIGFKNFVISLVTNIIQNNLYLKKNVDYLIEKLH